MDSIKLESVIRPSQGVHLVIDKSFLKGSFGILVPKTSDGRVLFAIPWLDHVIRGTTDSIVDKPSFNPLATQNEINFILENIKNYLEVYPNKNDIKSVFVGLRPLVASNSNSKSKDLSRKHKILVSDSGLVSVIGGKWTTYRKMAWLEILPQDINDKLELKFYYGHLFCHVFHHNYILKKGVDAKKLKKELLEIYDKRGAEYPALCTKKT